MDHAPEYEPLYAELAVPSLDEQQLLARFLLPAFSELAASVQERALARVLAQWNAWRDSPGTCAALAATPFVLDGGPLDPSDLQSDPPGSAGEAFTPLRECIDIQYHSRT